MFCVRYTVLRKEFLSRFAITTRLGCINYDSFTHFDSVTRK